MQVILGGGGAIGKGLAQELSANYRVRVVARSPKSVPKSVEFYAADLLQPAAVLRAVEGAEVAYLTAGLRYKTKVWQEEWPRVMRNTIDACAQTGTRLVFLDNIYMYDPNHMGHMAEKTPLRPTSQKGKVRAQIAHLLMDKVEKGQLQALIARSADFYGPKPSNSFIEAMVVDNLVKNKAAMWFVDIHKKHTCTFTPDAAKALVLLGNNKAAYNQVWHLPTDPNGLTGQEWIQAFAEVLHRQAKINKLSKTMIKVLGWFISVLRESYEMLYQYDRDYFFNSAKFNQQFNFSVTPYAEGIRQVISSLEI